MPRRKKARRSQVARSPSRVEFSSRTPRQHVRHARDYPIDECWITEDWADPYALVQVIIARQQPDGDIVFGVYLLDKGCLGLKNTFCNAGFSRKKYRDEVVGHVAETQVPEICSPELAHQIIYQAIDYATRWGFKPQKHFRDSRQVLAPRGAYEEEHEIEFGLEGQPFFFAGPYDKVDVICRKLDRTAGQGNYRFVVRGEEEEFPLDSSDKGW